MTFKIKLQQTITITSNDNFSLKMQADEEEGLVVDNV